MKLPANWKTTAAGLVSLLMAAFQAFNGKPLMVTIHDPAFQSMVLLGILGILAKDFDVTGGTTGQPSTPQALMDANQHPSVANPPVGPVAQLVTAPGTANAEPSAPKPTPEAKQ